MELTRFSLTDHLLPPKRTARKKTYSYETLLKGTLPPLKHHTHTHTNQAAALALGRSV